jgi:hypothetical protein
MIKVHHPEVDQEEVLKAAGRVVRLIDTESQVKEAASSAVSDKLIRENLPDDDHFMVHLIAMGDSENYGPNRNADWWPKQANIDRHHTFVSHGHFFREHANRDPKNNLGHVKASAHNGDMSRIELVIHGSKKRAEEEYELAKAGKALSFSMSARVPYDVCSICDNKATKSANYCSHLKSTPNQFIPEFQKFAYAINAKPTFFDISRVANPADRIAHYLEYRFSDDLKKSASTDPGFIYSDVLAEAEGVCIPDIVEFTSDPGRQKMLEKLAAEEAYIEAVFRGDDVVRDAKYQFVKYSSNIFGDDELTDNEVNALRKIEPGVLFRKLADHHIILPFNSFVSYITGDTVSEVESSDLVKFANCCTGSMFRDLVSSMMPQGLISAFDPSSRFMTDSYLSHGDEVEKFMTRAIGKMDLPQGPASTGRLIRITISSSPKVCIKSASEVKLSQQEKSYARTLAQSYGLYKLAYLNHLYSQDFGVDDTTALSLACHHIVKNY